MDADFFGYIIIALVLLVCLKVYYESDAFNLKCIISSVDGNRYCVREREKMEMAADLLAKVTKKSKLLVYYLQNKLPLLLIHLIASDAGYELVSLVKRR